MFFLACICQLDHRFASRAFIRKAWKAVVDMAFVLQAENCSQEVSLRHRAEASSTCSCNESPAANSAQPSASEEAEACTSSDEGNSAPTAAAAADIQSTMACEQQAASDGAELQAAAVLPQQSASSHGVQEDNSAADLPEASAPGQPVQSPGTSMHKVAAINMLAYMPPMQFLCLTRLVLPVVWPVKGAGCRSASMIAIRVGAHPLFQIFC